MYKTTDTAEAAYLALNGIKLVEITRDSMQSTFVMDSTEDSKVNDLLLQWAIDCPERKFFKAYRGLLWRVKQKV